MPPAPPPRCAPLTQAAGAWSGHLGAPAWAHAHPLAAAGADGAKTGTPSSMEAVGAPAPPNHNYTRGQEGESLWGNEGLLEGRLAAEEPQTHKCLLQVLLLKPRREGGSFSR